MRRLLILVGALLLSGAAWAELQNVTVGGEIRVRGRYYMNTFNDRNPGQAGAIGREVRIPNFFLAKRPIGPNGVSSLFDWDSERADWHFYETATLLNFKADFTDNVSAFVELYDFNQWGEDFRSNYITGADNRAVTNDDIEINQSYIQMAEVGGLPLQIRVGRQALKFGRGWVVSDMLTPTQRLSFDGVRATYSVDDFDVDVFATKLAENSPVEQDGDVDFYGIYATYKALEPIDISAYWMWLRDARSLNDTNRLWFGEWIENVLNLDDYDVTNLHTVGLRAWGKYEGFDYDLEGAYQFGDADAHGRGFRPFGFTYGDDGAEYDNWAIEFNGGYTFDTTWNPRVLVMGSYFGGEDNRDISFGEWLNPFYTPEASVSFNRLFSDLNHMPVVNDNGSISNFAQLGLGVEAKPLDNITVHFHIAKDWVVAPFDYPRFVKIGKFRVPLAPNLSFWTQEMSDDIGWEAALWVKYDYSKDLYFLLYYNHLFTGDATSDGAFIQFNGTDFNGGTDSDDGDYVFWMAVLKF